MSEFVTARRVTMNQAKRHFQDGGSVLVSERGHELTFPVGPQTTRHSKETTTWAHLVEQVREWRHRYPNQRFYVIDKADESLTFAQLLTEMDQIGFFDGTNDPEDAVNQLLAQLYESMNVQDVMRVLRQAEAACRGASG